MAYTSSTILLHNMKYETHSTIKGYNIDFLITKRETLKKHDTFIYMRLRLNSLIIVNFP